MVRSVRNNGFQPCTQSVTIETAADCSTCSSLFYHFSYSAIQSLAALKIIHLQISNLLLLTKVGLQTEYMPVQLLQKSNIQRCLSFIFIFVYWFWNRINSTRIIVVESLFQLQYLKFYLLFVYITLFDKNSYFVSLPEKKSDTLWGILMVNGVTLIHRP